MDSEEVAASDVRSARCERVTPWLVLKARKELPGSASPASDRADASADHL